MKSYEIPNEHELKRHETGRAHLSAQVETASDELNPSVTRTSKQLDEAPYESFHSLEIRIHLQRFE